MAIPQGRYRAATKLDLIQLLDQDERTHGFRSVLQDEDAAHTGVMLFKYHTVGATFASEAAAEVAFPRLAEQQKQLLADETVKLIRGDCTPLKMYALQLSQDKDSRAIPAEREEYSGNKHRDMSIAESSDLSPIKDVSESSLERISSHSSLDQATTTSALQASSLPTTSNEQIRSWLNDQPSFEQLSPVRDYAEKRTMTFSKLDVEEARKYPVLRFVCKGHRLAETRPDKIVRKIMKFLHERLNDRNLRNPDSRITRWTGRYHGVPINYNPAATNVRSIRARLNAAKTRKITTEGAIEPVEDILTEMEALMSPLIVWNRAFWTMSEFASKEIADEHNGNVYTAEYEPCCMGWFARMNGHLQPISEANQEEVVQAVIEFLANKASLYPKHPLVKYKVADLAHLANSTSAKDQDLHKTVERFNLKDSNGGFVKQLQSCFNRSDLTADEYPDLVEQKLYLLQREFPELNLGEQPVEVQP